MIGDKNGVFVDLVNNAAHALSIRQIEINGGAWKITLDRHSILLLQGHEVGCLGDSISAIEKENYD
jgi:hypothetical protein